MQVELFDGYLRAHVFDGVDSLAVSVAMWRMISEQAQLHQVTRVLVLESLEGTVSEEDTLVVIEALAGMSLADSRIAFVELGGFIQGNEHGEILALERNIDVMVFSEEGSARNWLLYGAD